MAKVSINYIEKEKTKTIVVKEKVIDKVMVELSLTEALALHAVAGRTFGNLLYSIYDKLDDALNMHNKHLGIVLDPISFVSDANGIIEQCIKEKFDV